VLDISGSLLDVLGPTNRYAERLAGRYKFLKIVNLERVLFVFENVAP